MFIENILTMPKDSPTPEEKLLRIIENGPARTDKVIPAIKPNSLKQMLATLKIRAFNKDILKQIKLAEIKKIIVVLCVIITLILITDFIRSASSFHKRFDRLVKNKGTVLRDEAGDANLKSGLTDVVAFTQNRNLFSFTPPKAQAVIGAQDILSGEDLKLVGVLWSNAPQAMIENTKEQKTYLLNTDDQLGEFKVKQILKDRVVLETGGQEKLLR